MRPAYLEAHLRREPVTVEKFQLLWQFYVKDGQPLRAAEVLAVLAESTEYVSDQVYFDSFVNHPLGLDCRWSKGWST